MHQQLKVYNTLTRQQEIFTPYSPPFVGMYVCGPTVYGQAHIGHARSAINFDIMYRYLKHIGYQVRYVRNITDVGHLTRDTDERTDKVVQQAQLENLEPMEVAQHYTNSYHRDMALLNVHPPSIEPYASGHITEQIAMIQQIITTGFAYTVNGSVYFDITAYNQQYAYGRLSGKILVDLLVGTRALVGQSEKKGSLDFALWKQASHAHLMRWDSPWGEGFPGWHIECTAIATKYLGEQFEIHGGGIDLVFPHHECELAQAQASHHTSLAKYWLHNNLVTINGQKMSKSLGNYITVSQLFQGTHPLLDQAYNPMTLRFFILQAHYRSTLNFSNTSLQAAHSAYLKCINGLKVMKEMNYTEEEANSIDEQAARQIHQHCEQCYEAMNNDFNTAKVIAVLFSLHKFIYALKHGQLKPSTLGSVAFERLKTTYIVFVEDILGLQAVPTKIPNQKLLAILIKLYKEAKAQRQYGRIDTIRADLKRLGILLQDTPRGVDWSYE